MGFFSKKNKAKDHSEKTEDIFTIPIEGEDLEKCIIDWLPGQMSKRDFERILYGAIYKVIDIRMDPPTGSGGILKPRLLHSYSADSGIFICDTDEESYGVRLFRHPEYHRAICIYERIAKDEWRCLTVSVEWVYIKYYSIIREIDYEVDGEKVFSSEFNPVTTTMGAGEFERSHVYCMKKAKNIFFELKMNYGDLYEITETAEMDKILLEKVFPECDELRDAIKTIHRESFNSNAGLVRTNYAEASFIMVEDGKIKTRETLVYKNQNSYSWEFFTGEEIITIYRNGSWKLQGEDFLAQYDTTSGEYIIQNANHEDISDLVDKQGLLKSMEERASSEEIRDMFSFPL